MTNPAGPPRVVIADDQALVRSGFRMILGAAGIPVVAEVADGAQALAAVLEHRPDVVLMDIRMPGMDGLESTRRILAGPAGASSRVIILTTFDLDQYVYAALTAGASGFLLKDVSPEQLVDAVRTVRAGDALLAPSITRRLVERFAPTASAPPAVHADLSELTPRELEVLQLLARGLSNAELAGELVLSEATVKTHVARILRKLGLRDRVQAVVLAYQTGLARLTRTPRTDKVPRPPRFYAGFPWLLSSLSVGINENDGSKACRRDRPSLGPGRARCRRARDLHQRDNAGTRASPRSRSLDARQGRR